MSAALEAIQQNNTLIVVKAGGHELRFLILTAPSPSNLALYIKDLKRHGVQNLVRVCTQTYKEEVVRNHGIEVHDGDGWFFEDGAPPPKDVLYNWIGLLEKEFGIGNKEIEPQPGDGPVQNPVPDETKPCVGVHCIAGLGRAPVLVAVALIELAGMPASEAVLHIRESRQGCFNQEQLKWLLSYKRIRKAKGNKSECCCVQ
eukprot:TRINITY_DN4247_c0_g2_i3.p1 TRINITY_DN4247_c0_g2~~TRINITY_DN4247_c0_g2_i3.p1  ORF type:complete len:201 (+),score=26.78 TRINITY_DN4247_c0_g2_i3:100-702(+)